MEQIYQATQPDSNCIIGTFLHSYPDIILFNTAARQSSLRYYYSLRDDEPCNKFLLSCSHHQSPPRQYFFYTSL